MIFVLALLSQLLFSENPCKVYSQGIVDKCGDNPSITLVQFNNSHYPKDMRGAIFSKSVFARNRVSEVDFSYNNNIQVQVYSSSFLSCKFDHSNFMGAYIKRANYRFSSFKEADFSGAKIENVSFRGADLSGAKFERAVLMFVDFRGANLSGVDFSKTTLISVLRDKE